MCIKSSHCNILNIYTIFVDYNLISVGDGRTPGEGKLQDYSGRPTEQPKSWTANVGRDDLNMKRNRIS